MGEFGQLAVIEEAQTILLIVWVAMYSFFLFITIRRRGFKERVVRYSILYLCVSALWNFAQIFPLHGVRPFMGPNLMGWIGIFGILPLTTIFLLLSNAFLLDKIKELLWLSLGAIISAVAFIVILYLPFSKTAGEHGLSLEHLAFGLVFGGWILMIGRTALLVINAYGRAKQPLHRNRLAYWTIALALTVIGDILLMAGIDEAGNGLHLAGVLIAAYVVLFHNLVDLLQTGLHSLSYFIITSVGILVFLGVFVVTDAAFVTMLNGNAILMGIALGAIMIILINPLLWQIQKFMNSFTTGLSYDPRKIVREYSLSISNILDLQVLAQVTFELIDKTFHGVQGHLFLVDEFTQETKVYYSLEPVNIGGEDHESFQVTIRAESKMAEFLNTAHCPLTQYDLDFLPKFQGISHEERKWIEEQQADVYVPIYSKTRWIGLFVLGPKLSGARYYDDDLALLSTLADQNAVALENARLFEDLVKLNKELYQTQSRYEEANRQLQEMDDMKSAFLGVITHELRTPFANIAFSLQLLEMYGFEHLLAEQVEQLNQLADSVKLARKMVDNLVTFASFLNHQVQLSFEKLEFKLVLWETLAPLKKFADEKEVALLGKVVGELLPVTGDRDLLSLAIDQLVTNAIKYTNPEGKVWISCWTTSTDLYFDVKDNGIGIPADRLTELWNSFTQMADPLKRGQEGLGLGLALVKFIVAAHGGRVWAESQEGSGSVFGFQIPLEAKVGAFDVSDVVRIGVEIPHPLKTI